MKSLFGLGDQITDDNHMIPSAEGLREPLKISVGGFAAAGGDPTRHERRLSIDVLPFGLGVVAWGGSHRKAQNCLSPTWPVSQFWIFGEVADDRQGGDLVAYQYSSASIPYSIWNDMIWNRMKQADVVWCGVMRHYAV